MSGVRTDDGVRFWDVSKNAPATKDFIDLEQIMNNAQSAGSCLGNEVPVSWAEVMEFTSWVSHLTPEH